MRVLIGYDGSECSRAAIADLARAGLPDGAEAVVLAVADLPVQLPYAQAAELTPQTLPPRLAEEVQRESAKAVAEARDSAAAGAARLGELFPRWTVRAEAVADSPYWALLKEAERWPADLVVVGSHGRSALGRLILGSVSQHVLSHAPCSVRIGRCRGDGAESGEQAKATSDEPARIIVAVDGSAGSWAAVEAVAARHWPVGTQFRVVTAVDLRLASLVNCYGTELATDDPADTLRCHADAAARRLKEAGLSAVPVVLPGDPKYALPGEAARWEADAIVLGAKGHTALQRFLLGSVSAAVAARSRCSVEVVRPRTPAPPAAAAGGPAGPVGH
jgi:nucleotide-binding universal stress UspA family protein